MELKKARVRYFLSINSATLPKEAIEAGKRTYRVITVNGKELEFSNGFTELHTRSYENILNGNGFRISEARNCIQIVSDIRHAEPIGLKGDYHPFAKLPLAHHPFGW
jgi:UDP-N-acetyl-2-amino-2-deoxyglucuronate dehydrogenase